VQSRRTLSPLDAFSFIEADVSAVVRLAAGPVDYGREPLAKMRGWA
jgi:hypothetical protein